MTPELTLQEKSAYLSAKLEIPLLPYETDIGACFLNIIPAMEKLGYSWGVVRDYAGDDRPSANFWTDKPNSTTHAEADTPEAAIVEAAYAEKVLL